MVAVKTKMTRIGNSKGVRMPQAIINSAHLQLGDTVRMWTEGERVIIEKEVRSRDALMALAGTMEHTQAQQMRAALADCEVIDDEW
jgi:antitoxin component of MazEF toxin-antitoxin module